MKILIVEDEFISRTLLEEMLSSFGTCRLATNGREAVEILHHSYLEGEPFSLVCLDIMMPEIDGQQVLAEIRNMERTFGIEKKDKTKVIMTTALDDSHNILKAFTEGRCEGYLTKPIDKAKLVSQLKDLNLIN